MFADDESEILQEYTDALEDAGFRVVGAGDGTSVLEEALNHRVSLIVLDVSMPQMGGVETCHCLKAMPKTRKTPVIITAHKKDPAARDLKERMQGSVRILRKPFTPEQLVAEVKGLVKPRLLL
jgi:DNA-binding response OmpR family regulator